MIIEKTAIEDVLLITNKRFGDERGWFSEVFRQNEFEKLAGKVNFVQLNESFSSHNILRGIHYQKPNSQGKLVRVVQGEVFDVAVDLRQDSPTFGKWVGYTLSAENGRQLWIPEGFGHGFYVTGPCAHFVYSCTDYYNPQAEHCLRFDDPTVNIRWPIKDGVSPIVSAKDMQGLLFEEAVKF